MLREVVELVNRLLEFGDQLRAGRWDRRERLADLSAHIAKLLEDIGQKARQDEPVPHDLCGELAAYLRELPVRAGKILGKKRTVELKEILGSAVNARAVLWVSKSMRDAADANILQRELESGSEADDREAQLRALGEAVGGLKALSNMVRL